MHQLPGVAPQALIAIIADPFLPWGVGLPGLTQLLTQVQGPFGSPAGSPHRLAQAKAETAGPSPVH